MANPALKPHPPYDRPSTGQVHDLTAGLAKIRESFLSRLADRCLEIETLALNIDQTGVQPELINGIAQRSHKIAGVASTLGFHTLGSLSEKTDAAMSGIHTQDDWDGSRALLEALLDEIEYILDSQPNA